MIIYTIGIYLYAGLIAVASLFNKKARLLIKGHNRILDTIRPLVDPNSKYLWFHASSLGEFEQGRPLIERIHSKHPECRILLTFFSPSGYEVRKDYKGADIVCYIPFDTPFNVRRFLDTIKVEKAFFIKYEFWPNFLKGLHKRGIEIFSISSIFRDNQLFFKWYGKGYAKALTYFKHLFVQDRHSKDLLKSIGITNVSIVGADDKPVSVILEDGQDSAAVQQADLQCGCIVPGIYRCCLVCPVPGRINNDVI